MNVQLAISWKTAGATMVGLDEFCILLCADRDRIGGSVINVIAEPWVRSVIRMLFVKNFLRSQVSMVCGRDGNM